MTNPEVTEILYINPAYEKIYGRTVESLYADPGSWREAVHPEDRERVEEAVRGLVRGVYDVEYRIVRPDGAVRWLWARATPVPDERGEICLIGLAVEDITERKRAEETLERSLSVLRATLESTADGILVVDLSGRVVSFRDVTERASAGERGWASPWPGGSPACWAATSPSRARRARAPSACGCRHRGAEPGPHRGSGAICHCRPKRITHREASSRNSRPPTTSPSSASPVAM